MPRTILFVALSIATILTISCTNSSKRRAVLTDVQVAKVLAELAIADGATLGLAGYVKDTMALRYYNQVFEITGVRKEDFEQSIEALSDNPGRLKSIMEQADSLLQAGTGSKSGIGSEGE